MSAVHQSAATAFERALKENDAALRGFLRRHLTSLDDVEDAVQETWLRMMRYREVSDARQLKALIFTVADSVLKDRYRRANTRLVGAHLGLNDGLEGDDLQSPQIPPERLLIGRQDLALVKEAIRNLPTRCRQVFMLHRFDGLSYREIAEKLGISPRTVEHQVAHALRLCRKAIGESQP